MRGIVLTVLVAIIGVAGLTAGGCGATLQLITAEGSGNVITREVQVEGFDKVRVQNQFKARITKGDEFRVTVRVDDNLVQDLDIGESGTRIVVGGNVMRNRTLDIRLQADRSYTLRNVTLEVDIVTPDLTQIDASGASEVKLVGFESGEDLTLKGSGASNISGEITADTLSIDVSGASKVRLSGAADHISIRASGASTADLRGVPAITAEVDSSGASRLHVNVTDSLDAVASGASHITYQGSGHLDYSDTSGAAKISRN
jgi:hypothetical protein